MPIASPITGKPRHFSGLGRGRWVWAEAGGKAVLSLEESDGGEGVPCAKLSLLGLRSPEMTSET